MKTIFLAFLMIGSAFKSCGDYWTPRAHKSMHAQHNDNHHHHHSSSHHNNVPAKIPTEPLPPQQYAYMPKEM